MISVMTGPAISVSVLNKKLKN